MTQHVFSPKAALALIRKKKAVLAHAREPSCASQQKTNP
jgi:hypothetical protein